MSDYYESIPKKINLYENYRRDFLIITDIWEYFHLTYQENRRSLDAVVCHFSEPSYNLNTLTNRPDIIESCFEQWSDYTDLPQTNQCVCHCNSLKTNYYMINDHNKNIIMVGSSCVQSWHGDSKMSKEVTKAVKRVKLTKRLKNDGLKLLKCSTCRKDHQVKLDITTSECYFCIQARMIAEYTRQDQERSEKAKQERERLEGERLIREKHELDLFIERERKKLVEAKRLEGERLIRENLEKEQQEALSRLHQSVVYQTEQNKYDFILNYKSPYT